MSASMLARLRGTDLTDWGRENLRSNSVFLTGLLQVFELLLLSLRLHCFLPPLSLFLPPSFTLSSSPLLTPSAVGPSPPLQPRPLPL